LGSRNLDAQFVEITRCQAVDYQEAEFERDASNIGVIFVGLHFCWNLKITICQ